MQPRPRLAICAWKRESGRGLFAIAQKLEDKKVVSHQILKERLGTRPEAARKMLCLSKGEL